MPLSREAALALWTRASHAEIGIGIRTKDKRSLQNMLYAVRQEANDPSLANLVIVLPKTPEDEVWICRKQVELPTDA